MVGGRESATVTGKGKLRQRYIIRFRSHLGVGVNPIITGMAMEGGVDEGDFVILMELQVSAIFIIERTLCASAAPVLRKPGLTRRWPNLQAA